MKRDVKAADVARILSDPVRFSILLRLIEGPAAVTDLVQATGASQPSVSNHLALLREERLVSATRDARHVTYRLSNPAVAQAVEALMAIAPAASGKPRADSPLAMARTCYDHLAGRLGVAVLDQLIQRRALAPPTRETGELRLLSDAREVFGQVGIDLAVGRGSRRRFAYACLDWTERRPHLGGWLGAALCDAAFRNGWVVRRGTSRAVNVTSSGRRAFRRVFGVTLRI